MSYIRAISNPEGLYIIGGIKHIEIFLPNQRYYEIPRFVFHGILKKFLDPNRIDDNLVQFRGAKLAFIKVNDVFLWRFSYKTWYFDLYETSLGYLAYKNEFRWKKD